MRDVVNMRNDISSVLTLKDDVTTLSSQVFDNIVLCKIQQRGPRRIPGGNMSRFGANERGHGRHHSCTFTKATASDNRNSLSQMTIKLHRGQALDDLITVFEDTSVDPRVFVKTIMILLDGQERRGFG